MSQRNDDPQAASRPFDVRRDGFVMAEGRLDGALNAGAMRAELGEACLAPGDVDVLNAHGSGTPLGDRAEALSTSSGFGGINAALLFRAVESR
jgi:3-oxoacyl-(acyl-carrier-protein) synthase